MFELILVIGAVVAMSRIADADTGEGFKWGAVTLGLCLLSFFIPVPFLRIFVAIGATFGLMTYSKKLAS